MNLRVIIVLISIVVSSTQSVFCAKRFGTEPCAGETYPCLNNPTPPSPLVMAWFKMQHLNQQADLHRLMVELRLKSVDGKKNIPEEIYRACKDATCVPNLWPGTRGMIVDAYEGKELSAPEIQKYIRFLYPAKL